MPLAQRKAEQRRGWFKKMCAADDLSAQLQQYREQDSRALVWRMFDDAIGRLIVEQAAGFTIEFYKSRMFVHRKFYSPEDTLKPALARQMFTIAAVLGPVVGPSARP